MDGFLNSVYNARGFDSWSRSYSTVVVRFLFWKALLEYEFSFGMWRSMLNARMVHIDKEEKPKFELDGIPVQNVDHC